MLIIQTQRLFEFVTKYKVFVKYFHYI